MSAHCGKYPDCGCGSIGTKCYDEGGSSIPVEHDLSAGDRSKLITECYRHIANCVGVKEVLSREPEFAIMVEVAGIRFGLCATDGFVDLLNIEIEEAGKCIKGDPNLYE